MARTAWIQELSVPSIWYMSPCVMPVYTFTSSMYTVPVPWAEMTSSPADAVPNWMWFVMRTAADIMKITAAVQERSISVEKAPVTAERPAAVLLSRDNGEKNK